MFSLILFLICFCLASIAMYEPESKSSTTADSFDQFYSAVKEVFAPEPEVIAEALQPLYSAQTNSHHQVQTNINSAWVTPEEQELINPTTQLTIRQLRDHVRQQNLQVMIKEQLDKSVNHSLSQGGITVDIVCLNLMRSLVSSRQRPPLPNCWNSTTKPRKASLCR